MQRSTLYTPQITSAVYMRHGMPLDERPELTSLKTLPTTHLGEDTSSLSRYLPTPAPALSPEFPAFSDLCDSLIERRMLIQESRNSRSTTPCSRPAPVKLPDCSSGLDLPPTDDIVCGTPLKQLYDRKVASAKALLEQLEVSKERHEGMKAHLNTQREQLRHNSQLICAELQAKRNALVAQIDAHLHEATKSAQLSVKEKERFLSEKEQEMDIVLQEITQKVNLLRLATTAEAKSKFVQEFATRMEEAETALKLWVADSDIPAEWVEVAPPKFSYVLTPKDVVKGPLLERDINREKNASPVPIAETRLGTTDKPILVSHSRRHQHHHSRVPKLHLPEDVSQSDLQEKLMRQNRKLMKRLEKLESTLCGKIGTRTTDVSYESQETKVSESGESTLVSISALISDSSDIRTDRCELAKDDGIRLYIPQGYPPYSCFYHVSVHRDTTAAALLASVVSHMGLSLSRDHVLTIQKKPSGSEECIAPSENVREKVGCKRESGWPRLFLKLDKN